MQHHHQIEARPTMNIYTKREQDPLLNTVQHTMSTYGMLATDEAVLVGVSGGPDSVALLHALYLLKPPGASRLGIAHINHGLRAKDADADQQFVAHLALDLALPYHHAKVDVRTYAVQAGLSLEEAGRDLRYRAFEGFAHRHGYNKIALGHHREDNAELMLMNLIRGSGALGLAGIPPVRGDRIIRPLLDTSRRSIMAFLHRHGIAYISDRSNMDRRFWRNQIRHELLPYIQKAYNPNIVESLNRSAILLRAEDQLLERQTRALFKKTVVTYSAQQIIFDLNLFSPLDVALQRRLIRTAIARLKGNLRRIQFAHVAAVLRLLDPHRATARLDLADRIRVERHHGRLLIMHASCRLRQLPAQLATETAPIYNHNLPQPGSLWIPEIKRRITLTALATPPSGAKLRDAGHCRAFFDMETLAFPLTVRSPRNGDRFAPMGLSGTQTLKKFFTNHKITASRRNLHPVILSGDQIVWVAGIRIGDAFKVTAATRHALLGELLLA